MGVTSGGISWAMSSTCKLQILSGCQQFSSTLLLFACALLSFNEQEREEIMNCYYRCSPHEEVTMKKASADSVA